MYFTATKHSGQGSFLVKQRTIDIFLLKNHRHLPIESVNDPKFVALTKRLKYSASMKSNQYRNFDILENIQYSPLATVTFMFLVNVKLVGSDKTVTQGLELWCM